MDRLDAKTQEDFERLGVRFRIAPAGEIYVAGPAHREDVLFALRTEVARRAEALRPQLRRGRRARIAVLVSSARTGACDVCGDNMPHFRGGMCALCAFATKLALRPAGGGAP